MPTQFELKMKSIKVDQPFRTRFKPAQALDRLAANALTWQSLVWNGQVIYRTQKHEGEFTLIHSVARELATSSESLIVLLALPAQQVQLQLTDIGKRLLQALTIDYQVTEDDFPLYKKAPIYRLFHRMRRCIGPSAASYFKGSFDERVATHLKSRADKLVSIMRRRLKSKALRIAQAEFCRNAKENFIGLSECIDRLARTRKEVIVLRFDLFMRPFGSQPAKFGEAPDLRLADEFVALCRSLHDHMEYRFKDSFIGYAWTLELGREAGFHKHYLVFLDSASSEDHVAVVQALSDHWVKLTNSRGYAHNCNEHAPRYKSCAIGRVRLDDPKVIDGLRFIVVYFTLAGLFVKLRLPQGYRTHHKGKFPKLPVKANRVGRPLKPRRGAWAQEALDLAQSQYLNFM